MAKTILRQIPQNREAEYQLLVKSNQRISKKGRILVSKTGWAFRGLILAGMTAVMIYNLSLVLPVGDPLIVYSTVMPIQALATLLIGWIYFKNRATGAVPDDVASVVIPVYNQENLIEEVLDAVFSSTYPNLEVVAVDDGSKDRTTQVLDDYARKNPQLKVIHKPNGGKRTAVATGFYAARGNFLIFIDSDSIIDKNAVEEIMKTFAANPKVGGIVGHGKILNCRRGFLTRCQDAWYDYSFNVEKTTESTFGTVLCLSGCLAAYRREAIARFMMFWAEDRFPGGDDRHLTTYAIATEWARGELAPISRRFLNTMASYDDSEDRGLTSQAVAIEWETVYVPTAIVYTEVPETPRKYLRQQTRWRKGYLRSSFFMSAFFWRKHPVMSSLFYLQFMNAFLAPVLIFSIFVYGPLLLHSYLYPFTYLGGQLVIGLMTGADYKFRDPTAKHWLYMPMMNLISALVLPWLLFPAILGFRGKGWLTR
jgi:hyaluronan synthase